MPRGINTLVDEINNFIDNKHLYNDYEQRKIEKNLRIKISKKLKLLNNKSKSLRNGII